MVGDAGIQTGDRGRVRSSVAELVLRAVLPASGVAPLPVLGDMTFSVEHRQIRSEQAANIEAGCFGFALSLFGARGSLWVEKGLARLAVDALLGRQPPFGRPTLSRIERGLLQGIAAGAAMALGAPATIQIGGDVEKSDSAVLACLRVRFAGNSGRAWLCLSLEFVKEILKSSMVATDLLLELASTSVPPAEIASALAGDAVVFDEVDARSNRRTIRLRLGDQIAVAHVSPDGRLTGLERGDIGDLATQEARRPSGPPGEARPTRVEVTAEICRLGAIDIAAFIDTPELPKNDHVVLRLAGAPWAEGVVTSVEDRLAVRLTKLVAT